MKNSIRDKRISNIARVLLCLWNIGLFAWVWFMYYNRETYSTHRMEGFLGSVALYTAVYGWFCHTYHAFRLASTTSFDAVFAQVISFGVPDLAMYLLSSFSQHYYADIIPGACTAAMQILGTALLVLIFRFLLRHYARAGGLTIIYGDRITEEEAKHFANGLESHYPHIFSVRHIVPQSVTEEELDKCLDDSAMLMLYEIRHGRRSRFMKYCTERHIAFYFTPEIEDIFCQGSEEKNLTDTPLFKYRFGYLGLGKRFAKRTADLLLSAVLLVVLSPLMLITAAAIKLEDGGPVLFKQDRCTRDGRVFKILKFRSMIVDAEKYGVMPSTGERDPRITKVGRIIRAARLDELPQLINILKDDMSFVGPRPERIEHVEAYTAELPEFAYRLRVKGGLTGLAQIWGKYNTSAYDKLRWDLMYIENQSLYLDFKLMVLTLRTVFQKESTEGFSEAKSRDMNRKGKKK